MSSKNRFVVYTVVVGDYDEIKQPLIIDDRFDYVLFTNMQKEPTIGVWQVRSIPYLSNDCFKLSRWPKIRPEKVLPEYEAWLYYDGKLQLIEKEIYDRCVNLYEDGIEWAGCNHAVNCNLYEEMSSIILNRSKGIHDYECIDWYYYLKSQQYPGPNQLIDNYLFEAAVIFRRNTSNVEKVNGIWWWSVENYIRRDQFALMFALWKVKEIKVSFLIPKEADVLFGGKFFLYSVHKSRTLEPLGLLERVRRKIWRDGHKEGELYTQVFEESFQISSRFSHFALAIWTLLHLIRYGTMKVFGRMN